MTQIEFIHDWGSHNLTLPEPKGDDPLFTVVEADYVEEFCEETGEVYLRPQVTLERIKE